MWCQSFFCAPVVEQQTDLLSYLYLSARHGSPQFFCEIEATGGGFAHSVLLWRHWLYCSFRITKIYKKSAQIINSNSTRHTEDSTDCLYCIVRCSKSSHINVTRLLVQSETNFSHHHSQSPLNEARLYLENKSAVVTKIERNRASAGFNTSCTIRQMVAFHTHSGCRVAVHTRAILTTPQGICMFHFTARGCSVQKTKLWPGCYCTSC